MLLLGTAFLTLHAQAELLSPGAYHGYYSVTRWGSKVLHIGPYHQSVSDKAAALLEKHRGKPLKVQVSSFLRPGLKRYGVSFKGTGMIDGISEISVAASKHQGLSLSTKLDSHKVEQGHGASITFSLRNDSNKSMTIPLDDLALAYATDSPKREQNLNYDTPSDIAYWYYRGAISCHETMLHSLGAPLEVKGEGFSGYHWRAVPLAPWVQSSLGFATIKLGGWIEVKYVVAKELLADDYEVFFYLKTGNFSYIPGPMSNRLALDIEERQPDEIEAEQSPAGDTLRSATKADRMFDISYQRKNYKVPEDELWKLTWKSPYQAGEIVPAYQVRVLGRCFTTRERGTQIGAHNFKSGGYGMVNINATNTGAEIWIPSGTEFYLANDRIKVNIEVYKNDRTQ